MMFLVQDGPLLKSSVYSFLLLGSLDNVSFHINRTPVVFSISHTEKQKLIFFCSSIITEMRLEFCPMILISKNSNMKSHQKDVIESFYFSLKFIPDINDKTKSAIKGHYDVIS